MRVGGLILSLLGLSTSAFAADIDFAHDIAPVLREHCGKCHTDTAKKGGLSLNTRESLLAGGESGPSVLVGKGAESELLKRLTSTDNDLRMPPEGPRVPADKVALIRRWIDSGLKWEDGFTFGKRAYEPPLKPRRVELPPAQDGRVHPLDRLIDAHVAKHKLSRPQSIDDATFLRRASLDLIGLLPTPDEYEAFVGKDSAGTATNSRANREKLVRELLDRDLNYAEHWLTFWNDLLRNDYTGTGFITGGRKQITRWLYAALASNKPYDQMARELIAPTSDETRGFIEGIRWRGEVSAGQTVEIQFAQSVGQSFLGINLKCASCHDSFIDRWKLDEAYGLAAIYSQRPLDIHRCDKPIGKTAQAAWLFPEIGQVDPKASQPERLKQLAALMTHPENGRFTRTIVNRLWHRLMGRGLVHPTDAMQTEPWNADVLDYLATHLSDNGYDLKQTLALITTSEAYQSRVQVVGRGVDDGGYVYAGPRAKRLTAEQFMDSVWQLTGAAPTKMDAQIIRGKREPVASSNPDAKASELKGQWIWAYADVGRSPGGETIVFRKQWTAPAAPTQALAVISCDNSYTLFVNGQRVHAGESWNEPDGVSLLPRLKAGANEIVIVGKNGGSGPNPAGLFFEVRLSYPDKSLDTIATDASWQWAKTEPDRNGKFKSNPTDWQAAALAANPQVWSGQVSDVMRSILAQGSQSAGLMVRASLVKSDFLMRTLGRPNRDQIVTVRPDELSTLEAIDLANGQVLADYINRGAKHFASQKWNSPTDGIRWLYRFALSRDPLPNELSVLLPQFTAESSQTAIEDVLWSLVMHPEFQIVR